MSTAKPEYTAVSVTMAARDDLRELAVDATTLTRTRMSMSATIHAARLHAQQDPEGFRVAAQQAVDDVDGGEN